MIKLRIEIAAILILVALAVAVAFAWRAERRDRAELATQLARAKSTIDAAAASQRDRDAKLAGTLQQLDEQKRAAQSPQQLVDALTKLLALPTPLRLAPVSSRSTDAVSIGASHAADAAQSLNRNGVVATGDVVSPAGQSPASKISSSTASSAASSSSTPQNPAANSSATGASTGVRGSAPIGSSGASLAAILSGPSGSNVTPAAAGSGRTATAASSATIPAEDLKPLYDFAIDCKACQARLAAAQSDLTDERTKSTAIARQCDLALTAAKGGSAWRRVARAAKWFLIGAAAGGAAVALKRH